VFSKVVSSILFDDTELIFIGDTPLPAAISNYVNLSLRANFNVLNLATYDLFQQYNLTKLDKDIEVLYNNITNICYDQYLKRLKTGPSQKGGVNMLDLIIKQSTEQGVKRTKEDIVGLFILMQFAGADTSKGISAQLTNFLSDKPEL
jgi:hypothetical protein